MSKPCILVYMLHVSEGLLAELFAGMEEEGIPYEVCVYGSLPDSGSETNLAFQAAKASRVNVGIGVTENGAVMQIRGVPVDKPVFHITGNDRHAWRLLGQNAARAVKGGAFII